MRSSEFGQDTSGDKAGPVWRSLAAGVVILASFGAGAGPGEDGKAAGSGEQGTEEGLEYLASNERSEVITGYVEQLSLRVLASCEDDVPPICQESRVGDARSLSTTYFGTYTIEMTGPAGPNGTLAGVTDFEVGLSAQQNHNIIDLPDGTPIEISLSAGSGDAVPSTGLITRDDYNEGTDESNVLQIIVGAEGVLMERANIQSGDVVDGEFIPWLVAIPRDVTSVQEFDRRAYRTAQALLDGLYMQPEPETTAPAATEASNVSGSEPAG